MEYRTIIIRTIIIVVMAMIVSSCGQWKMPENLVGEWNGIQSVSTRYVDKGNNFCFIADTLQVVINIHQDGMVSGFIGSTRFIDCRINKNRGWFGKILHIATDFSIEGFLVGKLNDKDNTVIKKIGLFIISSG